MESGWGVNILEDARHSSVLYKCKYFVGRADNCALQSTAIAMFFEKKVGAHWNIAVERDS